MLPKLAAKHCVEPIVSILKGWKGKPNSWLKRDGDFEKLTEAAWQALPLPIKLLGRDRIGWKELTQAIKREAFISRNSALDLRPDIQEYLEGLIQFLVESGLEKGSELGPEKPASPNRERATPDVVSLPSEASPEQARSRCPLGIDLGTTYSVVAYLDATDRPVSIPNASGDVLTPSVVYFEESGPIVGREAVKAGLEHPEGVAHCVKRDMGKPFFRHLINGERIPPAVISSLILKSLKADAERLFGSANEAVITVPAYFDEPRRQATIEAGRLAGLDVLDIINEPTAAAIAYGFQIGFLDEQGAAATTRPLRVLVYDLGGGTFDVTVVEIKDSSFIAVATDGDVGLGGKDWDQALVDFVLRRIQNDWNLDLSNDPEALANLMHEAEEVKKSLSARPKATFHVSHGGKKSRFEISRDEFEKMTAPLLRRTRTTVELVVREAGLAWPHIDQVLLVGGSTRMPMVARMLEEVTGKPPVRSLAVDEAVAHGAALYANLIRNRRQNVRPRFSITNINSHSLGIAGIDRKTNRAKTSVLIPRNTPLPHSTTKKFPTLKDNQASVKITVVEGESPDPAQCTEVGSFVIRGLPHGLPAGWPVEVTYRYGEDGRLDVEAKVRGHSKVASSFLRDSRLPESSLELWTQYVAAHEY